MDNWDEIRTAYQVARLGTVSGAAEALGVHHATVIRHVDALESKLGLKLFQRHARGYTPTEAGQELLQVGQETEARFAQMLNRINGGGTDVTGDLIVTSVPGISPLVTPALVRLQAAHPGLSIRYVTERRVFRLEYGEAHVALRAGSRPQEPDNVVQELMAMEAALYGSRAYLETHGTPSDDADLARHTFVGGEGGDPGPPYMKWLDQTVPPHRVAFRTNDAEAMEDAVSAGLGLGFLSAVGARRRADLVQVMPPRPEWAATLWLVTHVDLHRTRKLQAVLAELKSWARDCAGA
jgi:DNA-binding transcriptional LysR family regulator